MSRRQADTYRQALQKMRHETHREVADALQSVREIKMPKPPRRQKAKFRGAEPHMMFEGIMGAVAETIISAAEPGREIDLAKIVANMLVASVQRSTCVGGVH